MSRTYRKFKGKTYPQSNQAVSKYAEMGLYGHELRHRTLWRKSVIYYISIYDAELFKLCRYLNASGIELTKELRYKGTVDFQYPVLRLFVPSYVVADYNKSNVWLGMWGDVVDNGVLLYPDIISYRESYDGTYVAINRGVFPIDIRSKHGKYKYKKGMEQEYVSDVLDDLNYRANMDVTYLDMDDDWNCLYDWHGDVGYCYENQN